MILILILALLCTGCFSDKVPAKGGGDDLQVAAQAEWAFARAVVEQTSLPEMVETTDPPRGETDPSTLGVPGGEVQTICVYAPRWSSDSQEFHEWYAGVDQSRLPFRIELVPDDQEPPEGLDEFPIITDGKRLMTLGELQAAVEGSDGP